MLFVVEGPDKSGKTTMVNEIRYQLLTDGVHEDVIAQLHSGPIKRHPLDEYVRTVDCALQEFHHVICDRLHIGEAIYGPILRDENRMPGYVEDWIDMYLKSRGAVLVWVDTPMTVIYQRMKTEPDGLIDLETSKQVYLSYADHFAARGKRAVSLNPLRRSAYGSMVMQAGEHRDLEASVLYPHHSYIGGRHVTHLFVGDERSSLAQRRGLPGAFAPYQWSSGGYLMQALESFGQAHSYGLVNGSEDEDLDHLMHVLENPKVVALGATASVVLSDHGIEHATVPHPQWAKRFHFAQALKYGKLLSHAAITGNDVTAKELSAC